MRVYLDNAATTALDPLVLEAMMPYLTDHFGNASSIHGHGRETRSAIEIARKKIADLLNTTAAEIFFTSGGTEADNTAIIGAVEKHNIKHIITSRLEHHAVLHTAQYLEKLHRVSVYYVDVNEKGVIDLAHLESLLQQYPNALVSLMHGNNEIGNILDLKKAGDLCHQYKALFHSDTVQTIGHYPLHLYSLPVDFIAGSAHKFHGPKGIGLLYLKSGSAIYPYMHGGAQERNMRGGTENTPAIVGMAKALELAYQRMEADRNHITGLKKHMIEELNKIPGLLFNGESADIDKSLMHVLNVSLPPSENNEMLVMNLDIAKISASAGSACTSGTNIGSHVLEAIGAKDDWGYVRFSFGRNNTKEEIDYCIKTLVKSIK
ncbi:cysteine desulfurase family protein [Cytophaga hutchinsonii]|uniref:cysteine desulfurase n=1 Tax=Cytophaga hutchinsonii (strain ATCC 33406 / DSM 1761 / CIP 103989 / NBRC 15051 / NCIMB 9469 / D465) TaxID=269798 RepID=A0A6N4SWN3_CYTH3|nr:cysteine desulfurase family protein [Cytophaga hutchinsonii]ABG60718.1 cysteine desulfurase [Cytophaga hutchinsonii ATCC 33406]SFX70345.1 cysteine desulfurase [Cytophaga hutchinsonii ATCC 33406]